MQACRNKDERDRQIKFQTDRQTGREVCKGKQTDEYTQPVRVLVQSKTKSNIVLKF